MVGHVPNGLQVAKAKTFDQARHLVEQIGQGDVNGIPRCTGNEASSPAG
jgi:hypothetical protein